MRVCLLPCSPSRSPSSSSSSPSSRERCLNCVVCQFAPSPLLCPSNSRLQLKPLKPAARIAAGTWPWRAVSGLSCGPQTALGTVSGIDPSLSLRPLSAPSSAIEEKNTAPTLSDVPTQRFITVSPPLVLLPRRRGALRERPHALPELQRQHTVVLAGSPQRSVVGVEMHLRRAPVRPARPPVAE